MLEVSGRAGHVAGGAGVRRVRAGGWGVGGVLAGLGQGAALALSGAGGGTDRAA